MSVSIVGSAVASFSISAAAASYSIDISSLTSSLTTGDLMVLVVNVQAASNVIDTPSGWTAGPNSGIGATNVRNAVFYRPFVTGDASVTISFSSVATAYGAVVFACRGADTTTPFGTSVTSSDTTSDTTATLGSATMTTSTGLDVILIGTGSSSTTVSSYPGSFTQIKSAAGKSIAVASQTSAAGTSNPVSATMSASTQTVSQHFEILPGSTSQTVYPATDVTTTAYTNVGGAGSYAAALADSSDATYAQSGSLSGTGQVLEVKLGTLTIPATKTGWSVAYRLISNATTTSSVFVELRQGTSTSIASETRTSIPTTWTDYTLSLTSTQAGNVTDGTDLRLRFTVTGS